MKKIYLLLSMSLLFMNSCQDINDEFDGLDDLINPDNIVSYKYTIVEDDYATIASATAGTEDADAGQVLKTDKFFSDNASPYNLIPYLLTKKYYTADIGSSALVTYQFNTGRDAVVSALSTTETNQVYILGVEDYKQVWGEPTATALTKAKSPEVQLPILLKKKYKDAVSGDYKVIEYSYSDKEPVKQVVQNIKSEEDFESYQTANAPIDKNGWTNYTLSGTKSWTATSYKDNWYAQFSSSRSEDNDAWMISPSIDLTGMTNPLFSFKIDAAYYNETALSILISTDYDEKGESGIKNAKWNEIVDKSQLPQTSSWSTLKEIKAVDLSSYIGKKVHIAFHYKGDVATGNDKTRYQIDDFKVYEEVVGFEVESKETKYVAYTFDGSDWKATASYIKVLQPEDYASMTLTSGILAKDKASHYLPIYAANNFGYTQPGNDLVIVYQNAKGSFYADRVKCIEVGKWEILNFTETRSDQFVMSSKGWIFDPTITITMQKADYTIVVDYVKDKVKNNGWDANLINSSKDPGEFYYGFSGNYGNVTYRVSDREKDTTFPVKEDRSKQLEFMNGRVVEAFLSAYLPTKLPDATPIVNGVEQKARITVLIYDTAGEPWNVNWTYEFQCIGNKEWKYLQRTSLLTGEVEKAEE